MEDPVIPIREEDENGLDKGNWILSTGVRGLRRGSREIAGMIRELERIGKQRERDSKSKWNKIFELGSILHSLRHQSLYRPSTHSIRIAEQSRKTQEQFQEKGREIIF